MVYNGTHSGLNGVLWAPHFTVTIMSTHFSAIQHGSNIGNIDIGDMFLNLMINNSLRNFFGVYVVGICWNQFQLVLT